MAAITSCKTDDPGSSESWQTVFFDDFNRADTVSPDIGSNWTTDNRSGNANINITGSRVAMSSVSDQHPIATYNTSNSDDYIRITAKITTGNNVTSGKIVLFARKNDANQGYGVGLYNNNEIWIFKDFDSPTNLSTSTVTLSTNTTYILEFILNGSQLTFNLKDDSYTIIKSLEVTDSTYTVSGNVGFMGEYSGTIIYLDDFKLEKYE